MSDPCPYCSETPTALDVDQWFKRIEAMLDARERTIVQALNENTTRTVDEYHRMATEVAEAKAQAAAARKDSETALKAVRATESQIEELRRELQTLRAPALTELAPAPESSCVHCGLPEASHLDTGHIFRARRIDSLPYRSERID